MLVLHEKPMTQMMMTKAMVEVVNECSVLSSKAIDVEASGSGSGLTIDCAAALTTIVPLCFAVYVSIIYM